MRKDILFTGEQSGRTFKRGRRIGIKPYHGAVYLVSEGPNTFAVKVPHPLGDPQNTATLRKEATVQEAFNHPNITRVELFDSTRDLLPGVEIPLLVTPLAQTDLKKRIKRRPFLTPAEVFSISEDTAAALAEIHSQNVLFLDISPSNVLLTSSSAELTDFGNARALNSISAQNFPVAIDVNESSDTPFEEQFDWAASIVYPMLARDPGVRVFEQDTFFPKRISFEKLLGPRRMNSTYEALEEVIDKAMSDPSAQYSSMSELLDDLRRIRAKTSEITTKSRIIIP